jgi:hypothetical protein
MMSEFKRLSPVVGGGPATPAFSAPEPTPEVAAKLSSGATPDAVFPAQGDASYLYDVLEVEPATRFKDEDGFLNLTDPEVLCNKCKHGFIVKSRAPVQNRKPDGSPFYFTYGQCVKVTPPMSLDDLRVEVCNQYEAKE